MSGVEIFPGTTEKNRPEKGLEPDMQSKGFGQSTRDWGLRRFTSSWQTEVEKNAPLADAETGARDIEGLERLFRALGERVARYGEEYADTDAREFATAIRPPLPDTLVQAAIDAYAVGLGKQGDQI